MHPMISNANPAHNPEAAGGAGAPCPVPQRTALAECADRAGEEGLKCVMPADFIADLAGWLRDETGAYYKPTTHGPAMSAYPARKQ